MTTFDLSDSDRSMSRSLRFESQCQGYSDLEGLYLIKKSRYAICYY